MEHTQFFFNAVKAQFNTLNIILLLFLLAYIFHKRNRRVLSGVFAASAVIFFLLASTSYFPQYLVNRIESTFRPFDISDYSQHDGQVFVHVLGAGYTSDPRLPSSGQISLVSLSRLAEGLRICNLIDTSVLVVSGNVASGDVSMASVVRKAAIEMGFDSLRIELLETPGTTEEEAIAFVDRHGKQAKVIIVSDAVHMLRAKRFFKEHGIEAYPAPTNYLVKRDTNTFAMRWMPSVGNFVLMDRVLREFFGSIKGWLN
jgi:uncharacterized SAM-binding protein YcdF (DUF218 family)